MQTRGMVLLGSCCPRRPGTLSRSAHHSPRQGGDWDLGGRAGSTAGPTRKPGLQLRSHQGRAGGKPGAGWWRSAGTGRAALGKHRFRFTLLFWLHHVACRILVPHLGTELVPLAVKAASPNHWTAGKFLRTRLLKREGPAQPSGLCGGLRPRPPIWLPVRVLPSPPVSWSEPPHSPGGAPVEEGARLGPAAPSTEETTGAQGQSGSHPGPWPGWKEAPCGADLFSPACPAPTCPPPHLPGSVALTCWELSLHRPRGPGLVLEDVGGVMRNWVAAVPRAAGVSESRWFGADS